MESDKENVEKFKSSTRIPLPVNPLPAIPKRLLMESILEIERRPLRTISNENTAGPSHERVSRKKKNPVIIDARYVTVRPKTEELDYSYTVFKDKQSSNSSKDGANKQDVKEGGLFVVHAKEHCSDNTPISVTPRKTQTLELSRVKNTKRSLKRPHSREIQGLSPLALQDKKEERVKKQLQFNESLQDRLMPLDLLNKSYMEYLCHNYTRDVFTYLVRSEKKALDVPTTQSFTRSCIINWLMKVNGSDGDPAVAQCACWYLDSILGTSHVQVEKLQLVAAACFWIAQKLYGSVYPGTKLVKFSSHAFCTKRLCSAEKAVLQKLNFPNQPVVAQDFINYLSWWCDSDHPGEIEVAATFLCMSGMMVDKCLCNHYPSVIAAASVRNALLLLRKRNMMMRLQACPVYRAAQKKAENISAIHSLLRKAVRMVANPLYEYKAPFDHYGGPPHYIAQRIASAANEFFIIDARNGKQSY